jgi:hypothetical protein
VQSAVRIAATVHAVARVAEVSKPLRQTQPQTERIAATA